MRLGLSYFGNRYPHHARADLRAIAEAGAGFVVHVMSESDLRWNVGTMAELVSIGQEHGLQPWFTPWALGGVFGGESPSYAVGERPDACQRGGDGRPLPALCPRHDAFRSLVEEWLDAAVAAGATIVQWDEPHLARPHRQGEALWACRCDACQDAFRTRFGEEMPKRVTPQVAAFLDDLMSETLVWLVAAASKRALASSIVLRSDDHYDSARWRAAAALAGVRYFGCTPYWLHHRIPSEALRDYLSRWLDRTIQATTGTAAEPLGWVQAFGVPAGREAEVEQVIDWQVAAGVRTIAVWSYLACVAMSSLAPDDPDATWAAVLRAFGRYGAPAAMRG